MTSIPVIVIWHKTRFHYTGYTENDINDQIDQPSATKYNNDSFLKNYHRKQRKSTD